jgi:hypothetical protein
VSPDPKAELVACRPMDCDDIDPETGEAWGVDPEADDHAAVA